MLKKLFKKYNKEVQDINAGAMEFESILDVIEKVTIKYIKEKKSNFKGLKKDEILSLEKKYNVIFPKAYKLFLERIAAGRLKIFDCQLYNIEGISDAQEVASELILADKYNMLDNYFAFSQWQGYQFYYFINSGEEDPDTFLYIEGGDDLLKDPPEIYSYGKFSHWLVDLAIYNMKIIGRVHKYKVEEGIVKLEKLLTLIKNN